MKVLSRPYLRPISLGSVFYTPGATPRKTPFKSSGIMGLCLWKHQGPKAKNCPTSSDGLSLSKQEQISTPESAWAPVAFVQTGMARVLSP